MDPERSHETPYSGEQERFRRDWPEFVRYLQRSSEVALELLVWSRKWIEREPLASQEVPRIVLHKYYKHFIANQLAIEDICWVMRSVDRS